jgi:hypothetical protein
MGRISGVGQSQDQSDRGCRVAGDAVSDQGQRKTLAVLAGPLRLQTRAGGRARQGVRGGHGAPLDPACAERIRAAMVGVRRVRIARGDLIAALGAEGAQRMGHIGWGALSVERRRAALGPPGLAVDTPQQEGPTIRRQRSTLAISPDRLASTGRKTPWFWARRGQKHTSGGFSRTDGSHFPSYHRLTRGLCFFMKNSG